MALLHKVQVKKQETGKKKKKKKSLVAGKGETFIEPVLSEHESTYNCAC